MSASYAIPVRRASALPAASFRFHLKADTLAVRLTVPPIRPVKDLHLQVNAPCRAHKHKEIKGLKHQNLRDHMSEAELIFTALAELSTRQIAESVDATGMDENSEAGKKAKKSLRMRVLN